MNKKNLHTFISLRQSILVSHQRRPAKQSGIIAQQSLGNNQSFIHLRKAVQLNIPLECRVQQFKTDAHTAANDDSLNIERIDQGCKTDTQPVPQLLKG